MRRAAAASGLVLAVAGCGGGSTASRPPLRLTVQQAQGKRLFVAGCAACHRLADAGARGTAAADLDGRAYTEAEVLAAIAAGPGAMKANVVAGAAARAVADYVAAATSAGPARRP